MAGYQERTAQNELTYDVRIDVLLHFDGIVNSHAKLGKCDVVAPCDSLQLIRTPTGDKQVMKRQHDHNPSEDSTHPANSGDNPLPPNSSAPPDAPPPLGDFL